jgi:N-acetyl-beta-hexosaminidase
MNACSVFLVNCTSEFGLLDPTHPRTVDIVKGVLSEVATVFPDHYLHVGADEAHIECWNVSATAREAIETAQDFGA